MRLLIVEDDRPIAASLVRALGRNGDLVEAVHEGRAALAALATADYYLVILDLGLPDMDGSAVLKDLRRRERHTPVLILTARDELAERVRGLDLGADDYMVKPFELSELEARIRAVARRAIGRSGDDVRLGRLRLALGERRIFCDERPLELSPREFAVLEMLLLRHGRVVSKRRLLDGLSGWDQELSEGAIELYVHRVRRKLEGSGCNIRTLRGFGYVLQGEEP